MRLEIESKMEVENVSQLTRATCQQLFTWGFIALLLFFPFMTVNFAFKKVSNFILNHN